MLMLGDVPSRLLALGEEPKNTGTRVGCSGFIYVFQRDYVEKYSIRRTGAWPALAHTTYSTRYLLKASCVISFCGWTVPWKNNAQLNGQSIWKEALGVGFKQYCLNKLYNTVNISININCNMEIFRVTTMSLKLSSSVIIDLESWKVSFFPLYCTPVWFSQTYHFSCWTRTKTGWILDIGNSPFAFTTRVFFPWIISRADGHSLEGNRDVFRTSCHRNTPWQHVYNNMLEVRLSVLHLMLFSGGHVFMSIHFPWTCVGSSK